MIAVVFPSLWSLLVIERRAIASSTGMTAAFPPRRMPTTHRQHPTTDKSTIVVECQPDGKMPVTSGPLENAFFKDHVLEVRMPMADWTPAAASRTAKESSLDVLNASPRLGPKLCPACAAPLRVGGNSEAIPCVGQTGTCTCIHGVGRVSVGRESARSQTHQKEAKGK
jgi:hypothetical protein